MLVSDRPFFLERRIARKDGRRLMQESANDNEMSQESSWEACQSANVGASAEKKVELTSER